MGKRLLFFSSLFLFPFLLLAQKGVSFEAYSNAKQVVQNSYFEVTFTLNNSNGTNFKPPRFTNFEVLSGPSTSVSTQILNGQVTSQRGFSYTLMPTKLGKFTIASASIQVNGKVLKTNPLTIEVVAGRNSNSASGTTAGGGEVFIRAVPSTLEARVGQQILLDYKLYTTVNVDSYSAMEESDYSGFFMQGVKRYNSRVEQEVIEGVQYTTKILKRVALFPQQAGVLPIAPMKMQLGVVKDGSQRRSFFFNRNVKPVVVKTNPVEINVRSLPPNAPATFSGAVGSYQFQAGINQSSVTTDDALSVKMMITGNGDIKRVQAPALLLPENAFEVYDPKVLDENVFENQGEINGKKVVEYFTLPKVPGTYQIEPAFTYFDVDSSKYITLKTRPYQVRVTQGSGAPVNVSPSAGNNASNEAMRFIKLKTNLQIESNSFFGSGIFWSLSILPFLVLGGVFVWKQLEEKKNNLDIGVLKRRRANKMAQKHLLTAKKHLDKNQSRAFYDEVSRASLGYICDKLNIPLSELTKDNVREKLVSLEVSANNIEDFMKIIQTCEMALFAGMDNSKAMQTTYDSAMSVIAGIEEEMGK